MAFGKLPAVLPTLYLQGKPIAWTDEHKYLGVPFQSRSGGLFMSLYTSKALTAKRTACVTLWLQKHFGDLPPAQALVVYKARVASHLTYAAEVAIDVSPTGIALLEAVEVYFLRRILHLHDRSRIAILYSETGLIPLRFTRVLRPLRFLYKALQLAETRLVVPCLRVFVQLWKLGKSGWLGDIANVLIKLRIPAPADWLQELLSVAGVLRIMGAVRLEAERWVEVTIGSMRLPLMVGRRQRAKKVWSSAPVLFRNYLHVRIPAHRVALTRLVTGSHILAVEAAKWVPRPAAQVDVIPRHWWLCRLCGDNVEDELHVLLACQHPDLVRRRSLLLVAIWSLYPALKGRAGTPLQWWTMVMEYDDLLPYVAEYVYEVLELVRDIPMYIPAWYI